MARLMSLAPTAEVGRAPGVRESLDWGGAGGAGFTFAFVNAPATLIAAAEVAGVKVFGVNVHRRAVGDGFAEHVEDGAVEARGAAARDAGGWAEGVCAREEEDFRGVDVSESRDLRLVEED